MAYTITDARTVLVLLLISFSMMVMSSNARNLHRHLVILKKNRDSQRLLQEYLGIDVSELLEHSRRRSLTDIDRLVPGGPDSQHHKQSPPTTSWSTPAFTKLLTEVHWYYIIRSSACFDRVYKRLYILAKKKTVLDGFTCMHMYPSGFRSYYGVALFFPSFAARM